MKPCYFVFILFHLVACSDQVPTTTQTQNPDQNAQLKLTAPSLLGWGQITPIKMMLGDTVELQATLEKENGGSFANQILLLHSQNNNFLTENKLLTDHDGQASSILFAATVGDDEVQVSYQDKLVAHLRFEIKDPDDEANFIDINTIREDQTGILSWKTLAQVNLREGQPQFAQSLQQLDGQQVKIKGFMMPLENKALQNRFLLSIHQPQSFFRLPATAKGLIEVHHLQGLKFAPQPLIVQGKLKLLADDDMGLLYQLQQAKTVSHE